ncbi:MAG TPA: DNA polymerase IV, partial [Longimicrobiales bacterium]|nr:DNA polymerase IV [Longimicrobiales bacterium]
METPIIHVDMDAFFAAVEMRDHPEYRGKPVIIGGDPRRDVRAVVSTASYEARKFGVHSAMPLMQAWRRCPQGIFLRGSMGRYAEVSRQIMQIFSRYTPLVEPLSIDEAFLDVTGCQGLFGPPEKIARSIQADVARELD